MQKDYKRRIDAARKAGIDDMAEHQMSERARRQAGHRPYCCDMVRAQREQIRETPAEYVVREYGIRGDADGYDKGTAEYIPEQKG